MIIRREITKTTYTYNCIAGTMKILRKEKTILRDAIIILRFPIIIYFIDFIIYRDY